MRLEWKPTAFDDRDAIMDLIASDDPGAAIALDLEFEAHAARALAHPTLYKPGRVRGTREIVIRPNYIMVYCIDGDVLTVLRVLHARRQYP